MSKQPKLARIDNEMRRWCATVEEELSSWPDVSTRPMFGMVAFYRGAEIFAAVPRTRAAGTERSILIKLPSVRHQRLRRASRPGSGWATFEMGSDSDIVSVLQWLGRAYEKAHSGPVR